MRNLCTCHRRPYLICHTCAHEYCGETWHTCPRCAQRAEINHGNPTHPTEFYTRAVERLETLIAALKAHPGPHYPETALRAAQELGNAAYVIGKALQWLDKPTEDE